MAPHQCVFKLHVLGLKKSSWLIQKQNLIINIKMDVPSLIQGNKQKKKKVFSETINLIHIYYIFEIELSYLVLKK